MYIYMYMYIYILPNIMYIFLLNRNSVPCKVLGTHLSVLGDFSSICAFLLKTFFWEYWTYRKSRDENKKDPWHPEIALSNSHVRHTSDWKNNLLEPPRPRPGLSVPFLLSAAYSPEVGVHFPSVLICMSVSSLITHKAFTPVQTGHKWRQYK